MHQLLFALALAVTPAVAGPGASDADARVGHMVEHLSLDAVQAERVSEIMSEAHSEGLVMHAAHRAALDALRAARDAEDEGALDAALGDLYAARDAAEAHRRATVEAITAELTLVQQVDFVLAQSTRRERHIGGPPDGDVRGQGRHPRGPESGGGRGPDGALQGL